MRTIVLVVTILLFAVISHAAPVLNLYQGHGVYAAYSGQEQSVIVENGLVRVWYTNSDWQNVNYAPAGVVVNGVTSDGSLYGTANYPFTNTRNDYMECDTASFENAVLNGQAIPWTNKGTCVSSLSGTCVFKGPDGVYYMLGSAGYAGGTAAVWTSPTGYPGTWTQTSSNIGVFASPYAVGNFSFYWNSTTNQWDVFIEYANWSLWPSWRVSYWNGTSLTALTRRDSDGSPAFPGGVNTGQVLTSKYYGDRIHISHQATTANGMLPTQVGFWYSTAEGSGWTQNGWVLQLSTVQYFMGDTSKAFNSDSQLADPCVVELNGRTYLFYETVWKERYERCSLSVAWWNDTLSNIVAGYLGISAGGTPTAKLVGNMKGSFK